MRANILGKKTRNAFGLMWKNNFTSKISVKTSPVTTVQADQGLVVHTTFTVNLTSKSTCIIKKPTWVYE